MSTTKLILSRNIENLGNAGEVVEVKSGYARNYLLPRSYAVRWSKGAQRHIDQTLEVLRKKEIASVEDAIALRERIDQSPHVEVFKKSGSAGRLFGAVTAKDVGKVLSQKFAVPFDSRNIDLGGNIKKTGTYTATVRLLEDVTADIEVLVSPEE